MLEARTLIQATLEAGRDLIAPPAPGEVRPPPVVVPIRSLGPGHRERIAQHLLALDARDRYLRFGYAAGDAQIRRYVDSLDFDRDDIFGIYNRRLRLLAMAHLAYSGAREGCDACAEFGVSVEKAARGRGYGARLFDRAVMHARNEGVELLFIHALTENTAMLNIARKAGAVVECDGAESQAFLRLPPATLDSRFTEIVEEQMAQADYQLKVQAQQFRQLLQTLQLRRQGRPEDAPTEMAAPPADASGAAPADGSGAPGQDAGGRPVEPPPSGHL